MNLQPILFSIVIPTYNHAEFLKISLSSVVNQSYKNWEAIIVDNNSTDKSVEVINSFNDKRIKIISIHNNGVIAASRNLGIKESKGDWIAFLDSDDIWYQDKLRDINKNIKALKNIDVICNDEKIVFENSYKNKIQRYGPLSKNAYKHMLVYGNKLSTSATAVKRSFIVKNSIYFNQSNDFVTVEDYDFWLNLALSGANFKFLHQVHGEYFIHNSNNSKGGNNIHELNNIKLLKHHVFNVQTFDTKTHKLWKKINHRLTIHQEFSNINRNNFALKTFTISKLILKMPIFSIFYLVEKIYLRSANYLLSRFS